MMEKYAYHVVIVFCYVIQDNKVLLITREKPPYEKQVTVVGGKKEPLEDLMAACKREVFEETHLELIDAQLKGIINIHSHGRPYETVACYFVSDHFTGEVMANEGEGALEWCEVEQSYEKEGISDFYKKISPFVFEGEGLFMGSIRVDGQGEIEAMNLFHQKA